MWPPPGRFIGTRPCSSVQENISITYIHPVQFYPSRQARLRRVDFSTARPCPPRRPCLLRRVRYSAPSLRRLQIKFHEDIGYVALTLCPPHRVPSPTSTPQYFHRERHSHREH